MEKEKKEEAMNEKNEEKQAAEAVEDKENEKQEEVVEDTVKDKEDTSEEVNEDKKEEESQSVDEKISELEVKLKEAENKYFRAIADLENYRRRSKQDLKTAEKYRAQSLITGLLPVIDNFERAMQIEPDNEQTKSLLEGMQMVYRGLIKALNDEGAEQIEAVGKEFDPHFHQAVAQVEDENHDSNIVVEELQKGYKLKDRVIRPAMVKVNK